MEDQKVNKTIEVLRKELLKRGLTEEQAKEAINKTKLSDDDIKTLLQEAKDYEDKIVAVELSTIPTLAQEGYDLSVEVAKESNKLARVNNGIWFNEWVEKTFPAIKKATDKFGEILSEEVKRLTSKENIDKIIEKRGDKFDFNEVKLENELALYRFKRVTFPKVDAEFNVTPKMREDFINATAKQESSKVDPIIKKIDELNEKVMFIKETIAKTLFISLEEAHLIIVANNFFSTFFEALIEIQANIHESEDVSQIRNVFKTLKTIISGAYKNKQIEMKAKLEKIRAAKEDN